MSDSLDVALAYLDRLARSDVEGALALVAEDATFMDPDGSIIGKDAVRARFAGLAALLAGPFEQEIVGTTTEGSRVAIEATGSARLANGKTYRNLYHFLFEIADGRIVRFKEYCDTKAIDAFG
jgi:ketosteroid isomerase-like protein